VFEKCGAYNGAKEDKDVDPVPNKYDDFHASNWGNSVDFLEWFGVVMMSGFGVIIVDDTDNSTLESYKLITGLEKAEVNEGFCFNSA